MRIFDKVSTCDQNRDNESDLLSCIPVRDIPFDNFISIRDEDNFVYAFPEITENKTIVQKGERITKIDFTQENFNKKDFGDKINFLLSTSLAEVKRRGSLTNEIKLRSDSVKDLRDVLNKKKKTNFELEAVSMVDSKTAQPVIVELNIIYPKS